MLASQGFGGLSPLRYSPPPHQQPRTKTLGSFSPNVVEKRRIKPTPGRDLPDGLTAAGVAMFPLTGGGEGNDKKRNGDGDDAQYGWRAPR